MPQPEEAPHHRVRAHRLPRGTPDGIEVELLPPSGSSEAYTSASGSVASSAGESGGWFSTASAPQENGNQGPRVLRGEEDPGSAIHCIFMSSGDSQTGTEEEVDQPQEAARDGSGAAPAAQPSRKTSLGQHSVGSALHDQGGCRPCLFARKGCARGAACKYCHFHPELKRYHPSKDRRMRMKRRLLRDQEEDAAAAAASSTAWAQQPAYPATSTGPSAHGTPYPRSLAGPPRPHLQMR
mmetsp:Transcript_101258/g.315584  ORF Transcript_101258/g.315584 Transcript_101258/m.315584 type:complete len:238 (+) Transcript_101258:83-796(+)